MEDRNEQVREKSKKAIKNIGVIGHVDMGSTLLTSEQLKDKTKRMINVSEDGANTVEELDEAIKSGNEVIVVGSDMNDGAKARLEEAMKHIDFTVIPQPYQHQTPFSDYMNDKVFTLTNQFEKVEVCESDFEKIGEMGGKTKSSQQGFVNRITKRRKKKKNKKTHRK